MNRDVGSIDGLGMALGLSKELTDAEFRLLVALSQHPVGRSFEMDLIDAVAFGMSEKDANRAAVFLSSRCVLEFSEEVTQFFFHDSSKIKWRFYK